MCFSSLRRMLPPCSQEILRTYAQQLGDGDLEKLAAATPGMSGRDLRDVAEQAERRWASKARLRDPDCSDDMLVLKPTSASCDFSSKLQLWLTLPR